MDVILLEKKIELSPYYGKILRIYGNVPYYVEYLIINYIMPFQILIF